MPESAIGMGIPKLNTNQNSNPKPGVRAGLKRVIVGYRLLAMRSDQVDEVARSEGRGGNANVTDRAARCPWCFLKTSTKHHCRWRTEANKNAPPDGGPVRRVPIYAWVDE